MREAHVGMMVLMTTVAISCSPIWHRSSGPLCDARVSSYLHLLGCCMHNEREIQTMCSYSLGHCDLMDHKYITERVSGVATPFSWGSTQVRQVLSGVVDVPLGQANLIALEAPASARL